MLYGSVTERCRTPLRARLHGKFYIFTLRMVPLWVLLTDRCEKRELTRGHRSHRI